MITKFTRPKAMARLVWPCLVVDVHSMSNARYSLQPYFRTWRDYQDLKNHFSVAFEWVHLPIRLQLEWLYSPIQVGKMFVLKETVDLELTTLHWPGVKNIIFFILSGDDIYSAHKPLTEWLCTAPLAPPIWGWNVVSFLQSYMAHSVDWMLNRTAVC